ncbi:MAG: hypothetical protein RR128_05270 [Clostridium sp.]
MKSRIVKSIKIIALTIVMSIFLMTLFAKAPIKNLDGIYTLKHIETSSGQTKVFSYGGELIVKNIIGRL